MALRWFRRLPFGVIVIILMQLVSLLVSGSALGFVFADAQADWLDLVSDYQLINFSLNLLGIVVIFGLLRLRRWAWVLVMIQLGFIMAVDLVMYAEGIPQYPSMLTSVIIVFYLNQSEVQEAFKRRPARGEAA